MNRFLKIIFAAVLLVGLNAGSSFAIPIPVSFMDYISGPNSSGWTHILDDTEFTPKLVEGDTINVTEALLEIQIGSIDREGKGSTKLFQITAEGDAILLDTFTYNDSGNTDNHVPLWSIHLDALGNAATVLQAINDRSFAIAISEVKGSINHIDFAELSGNATVTPGGEQSPPTNGVIPEPSTFLLLGGGLAGVGLLRKRFKR